MTEMTVVPFADTQTLFQSPERLFPDAKRATLFGYIMDMILINCEADENWNGETKSFPLVSGEMPIGDLKSVFKSAMLWCSALDITLNPVSMVGGKWVMQASRPY